MAGCPPVVLSVVASCGITVKPDVRDCLKALPKKAATQLIFRTRNGRCQSRTGKRCIPISVALEEAERLLFGPWQTLPDFISWLVPNETT